MVIKNIDNKDIKLLLSKVFLPWPNGYLIIVAHFAPNCNSAFCSVLYFFHIKTSERGETLWNFSVFRIYEQMQTCHRNSSVKFFTSVSVPIPITRLVPVIFRSKCWSVWLIIIIPVLIIWLDVQITKRWQNNRTICQK